MHENVGGGRRLSSSARTEAVLGSWTRGGRGAVCARHDEQQVAAEEERFILFSSVHSVDGSSATARLCLSLCESYRVQRPDQRARRVGRRVASPWPMSGRYGFVVSGPV